MVAKKNTIKTTHLNFSIPSEIFLALRETENQFAANMTEEDFICFLGENKVSIFEYLDESTLREELANA